ncbi:MAG: hypothetical protein JWN78_3044 [Bacteroidota bacterium]|nr:hypothetical protein [Bacteroidota bacterium]
MATDFIIRSLQDNEFAYLFNLEEAELEKMGMIRMIVDAHPGFPCRVSLEDAKIGEEVILLPYQHHKTNSPYQSGGPIFVRRIAKTANLNVNEIPEMLHQRLLSLRGFDHRGIMKQSTVIEGENLKQELQRIFENPEVDYIHIHNAKPGCYNCMAERAS